VFTPLLTGTGIVVGFLARSVISKEDRHYVLPFGKYMNTLVGLPQPVVPCPTQ